LAWIEITPLVDLAYLCHIPLPGVQLERFRKIQSTLNEVGMKVLDHLRMKKATGGFKSDCFGKMLMEFANEEKVPERDLLSEIRLFMVAGMHYVSISSFL
jgi:hypothetical protein